MIGGLVAMTLDRSILRQLGTGRRTVVVTGTNGKSTTTRMTAAALRTLGGVATNAEGANMDAGLVAALAADRGAALAVLEVDEMHVPHVADAVEPAVVILLNLSRDQLDRVGEINVIERRLRAGLAAHPNAVVVANCDDVLMTSAAYDHTNVVWVAAGGSWAADSVSCPRSGEVIVREQGHWYSTGADFKRPSPQWWFDDETLYGPDGLALPMRLALPGAVNRGNATQAVAAAVALGADPAAAVAAVSGVDEVAGRYRTIQVGAHTVRMLLAKNPAGWQEALSMVNKDAAGVVIAVNGQVPDGEDLSWLWDVRFEEFEQHFQGLQWSPRVNAAPTSPCDWATPTCNTPWCTTRWPPSRPARPDLSRSSPTTPLSCNCNVDWPAMADSTVRIGLVLPDVMGTYGDGGNAAVLRQRLRLRGIAAEIVEITLADAVPDSLDLYTLGGAEDYAQRLATKHLIRHPGLQRAAARGAPVLAICAAIQVLGHWYETSAGERVDGVGLLDLTTSPQPARTIGELVTSPLLAGLTSPLTGFENHRGGTVLGDAAAPLGAVKKGAGNRAGDRIDGAVQGSVFATYMHGPCLARNPEFADLLLGKVVGELAPLDLPEVDLLRRERLRA